MKPFLTTTESADLASRLSDLRNRFSSAATPTERVLWGSTLADHYLRLGLLDGAADWLRAVQPFLDDAVPAATLRLYHLAALELWLEQGDAVSASRVLEQLRPLVSGDPEAERAVFTAAVRLALLRPSAQPFAALEKAFRHLRVHPSPSWGAFLWQAKAEWLERQGRNDEVQHCLKKAVNEALKSGHPSVEVSAWIALARAPSTPRAKAQRAAKSALERASGAELPLGVVEAEACLSELTRGRESESSLLFRRSAEGALHLSRQHSQRERETREADARLFEASSQTRRLLEAQLLAALAGIVSSGGDLARTLDAVYPSLRSLMPADIFGVALWDPGQRALDYAFFIEEGRRTRVGLIPIDSPRSLGAWCFRQQRALRIDDIDRDYSTYLKELSRLSDHRPKSMLFQPLRGLSGPLGIVSVQAFSRHSYGVEDEAYLAVLASCLALRIQVAGLSEGDPDSRH